MVLYMERFLESHLVLEIKENPEASGQQLGLFSL